jgi:regulator of RNase E activity RraA
MRTIALVVCCAAAAWGQTPPPAHSRSLLKVQQYTAEQDSQTLKLYEGLRVCDVIDGLDAVGLQEITMMDRDIRPMWRDEQKIAHRIAGVALTLRLVPAQVRARTFTSHADERVWETQEWAKTAPLAEGPRGAGYNAFVRPGTVLVVDNQARDNGFCGSNNAMTMFGRGLRGLVGNSVCRDMDEMVLARIPVYQGGFGLNSPRGINQGRMWIESYNQPIVVGGVTVMPGDVIVADADGVAVVPRARAEDVAKVARWVFVNDEISRGAIFDRIGKPRDWTVQGHTTPAPPSKEPFKR